MDILNELEQYVPLPAAVSDDDMVKLNNLILNEQGELSPAHWMGGKNISDMTVEELEHAIKTTTTDNINVSDIIRSMTYRHIPARHVSKISPAKKKVKQKMAKASRRINRKK